MSLTYYNGVRIEAAQFNGSNLEKIYFNGALVFQKKLVIPINSGYSNASNTSGKYIDVAKLVGAYRKHNETEIVIQTKSGGTYPRFWFNQKTGDSNIRKLTLENNGFIQATSAGGYAIHIMPGCDIYLDNRSKIGGAGGKGGTGGKGKDVTKTLYHVTDRYDHRNIWFASCDSHDRVGCYWDGHRNDYGYNSGCKHTTRKAWGSSFFSRGAWVRKGRWPNSGVQVYKGDQYHIRLNTPYSKKYTGGAGGAGGAGQIYGHGPGGGSGGHGSSPGGGNSGGHGGKGGTFGAKGARGGTGGGGGSAGAYGSNPGPSIQGINRCHVVRTGTLYGPKTNS